MIVLLPHVRDERWLLVQDHVDQATQHSRGVINPRVGALAEEEGQKARFNIRLLQLVDNPTEQHRLTLAGIALDPDHSALLVVAPSPEVDVFENPLVRVLEQAAFGLLNALLVVSGIGCP
jgi:hypothetical protein